MQPPNGGADRSIQNKTYPPLNLLRFPPWLTNLDRQTCIDPLIGFLRTYKSQARRSCSITLTGNRGRSASTSARVSPKQVSVGRVGVIHVALVASINRPHVRFASESDRIAAQQRNDAQCQKQS